MTVRIFRFRYQVGGVYNPEYIDPAEYITFDIILENTGTASAQAMVEVAQQGGTRVYRSPETTVGPGEKPTVRIGIGTLPEGLYVWSCESFVWAGMGWKLDDAYDTLLQFEVTSTPPVPGEEPVTPPGEEPTIPPEEPPLVPDTQEIATLISSIATVPLTALNLRIEEREIARLGEVTSHVTDEAIFVQEEIYRARNRVLDSLYTETGTIQDWQVNIRDLVVANNQAVWQTLEYVVGTEAVTLNSIERYSRDAAINSVNILSGFIDLDDKIDLILTSLTGLPTEGGFGNILDSILAVPGRMIKTPGAFIEDLLTPIGDMSHAMMGGLTNIGDFLKPFTEPGEYLIAPFIESFIPLFQPEGAVTKLFESIPMSIARGMQGAQDTIAGMFLSTMKTRSPANVTDFRNYLDEQTRGEGFWKLLQATERADPDTALNVANEMKNNIHTQIILSSLLSVLAETILPYQSGIASVIPSMWSKLIGADAVMNAFTGPIVEAGMAEPLRQWANRRWLPSIPSPPDIIRMYVREAHEPFKQVEIPGGFRGDMELHGYKPYWTNLWWGAHWELPPINLLYEFYHRFPEDFTRSDLQRYLKWHDYHPQEHDWLIRAAETLIPRVDIRRGLDYGIMDPPEVKTRYRMLGYSDTDAEKMKDIAVRFSLTAERNDLRRLHEKRFLLGLEDETNFRSNLEGLGFGVQVIDERAKYIKLRVQTEVEDEATKAVKERTRLLTEAQARWAFKNGVISEAQYRTRLEEMRYPQEDRDILTERAIFEPEVDESVRIEREILRFKIRTFEERFRDGAISKAGLISALMLAGLPEELAKARADYREAQENPDLVRIADVEAERKEARIKRLKGMAQREGFRDYAISRSTLITRLTGIGYDADEAEAIAMYEEAKREPLPPPPG